MAYLDGELSKEDRRVFEQLLEEHPEWRDELNEMSELVQATNKVHLREPDPTFWDNYWEEIDSRIHRRFGWFAALIGSLLLIVFGFIKVLIFAENSFVQVGILLIAVGMIILFITILRGRLLEMPRDRYQRIRR